MDRAKIISVTVEPGKSGLLHATSPQMRELLVSGDTLEELNIAIPDVIKAIFDAHGHSVSVIKADDGGIGIPMPWVVVPTADLMG